MATMVKPFDRYILKEIASPFGVGLLVYTSTLLIDQILRLSNMLIAKSVSPKIFFLILAFSLPDLLSFTIPMATLMGILAGMSRMSSDSEVLALRTMGIANTRILKPVLLFSFLSFLTSFVFISFLAPEANFRRSRMLQELAVSFNIHNIKPGIFYRDIPYYTIFFRDIDARGNWKSVFIFSQKNPNEDTLIVAGEGRYLQNRSQRGEGMIVLFDGTIHSYKQQEPEKYSITFFDQKVENVVQLNPIMNTRRSTQMPLAQLWRKLRKEPGNVLAQIEFHNKFALPFTSLAMGLLGLSLGVTTKKGGKTSGLIVSLGVIFIYYVLTTAARNMILKNIVRPWIGMWAPNLLLLAIGLTLFFFLRQEKEIHWEKFFLIFSSRKTTVAHSALEKKKKRKSSFRILDLYVLQRMSGLFFLILISLMLVFYIISIIDLMDEIIENKIPLIFNLKYNFFMTPYLLTQTLPIAILTSILLAFSFMSKNNEVIAVQVSGISLYRLTLPAILLGILVSAVVFGIQEQLLPQSNQKAVEILDIIHKKKTLNEWELSKYWVAGKHKRIYFYSYFEKELNRFVNFNILDFDDRDFLARRTTTQYAQWFGTNRLALTNAHVREYENQIPVRFYLVPSQSLQLEENRSSFFENVKFSMQMNIRELRRYIDYLRKNNNNSIPYEAQLYANYAYPLSPLVMAFIAIPFSFLMGNRGALFGIGIAVTISIIYWGTLGVFAAFGKTGILAPFISAFSPMILFTFLFVIGMYRVKT